MVDPLELPRGCSGVWLAASPLAASDTRASHLPRAPKFGSSGRSVGALIYGLPTRPPWRSSGFHLRTAEISYCEAMVAAPLKIAAMGSRREDWARPILAGIIEHRSAFCASSEFRAQTRPQFP